MKYIVAKGDIDTQYLLDENYNVIEFNSMNDALVHISRMSDIDLETVFIMEVEL
jgi:hypothetical protein